MTIPLGSSGGRQLTSTEDESRAFSCSSSGGVEGPEGRTEGGRRARSVIIHPEISPHSCGMYIILMRHVCGAAASSCPRHLGTAARGQLGQGGKGAAAQVSKHGSGEHDRLTGFNNVVKKKKRRRR